MFDIPPQWAAAFITAIVGYIGHRLWNSASDKRKEILEAAMGEARAVIAQLVLTAPQGTTIDEIILWCKGAVAIQLAKVGIDPEDPLVAALLSEAVAAGVHTFVATHPNPTSLKPPIAATVKAPIATAAKA